MKKFSLFKKGRYGWFHITTEKFKDLDSAIEAFKDSFNIKLGENLCEYKIEQINNQVKQISLWHE